MLVPVRGRGTLVLRPARVPFTSEACAHAELLAIFVPIGCSVRTRMTSFLICRRSAIQHTQ